MSIRIALAGNPNCGKTTMFNDLTGSSQYVGNWPGVTVEKKENSPFIIIILINSCRSTPVYDQDGLPVSHKANKGRHGFGIKSIKKVVKQYHGNLQMYYDNDSGTFHTIITLKQ